MASPFTRAFVGANCAMLYWIEATLAALSAVLWMVFGLGVPYALLALPRKDWRDQAIVLGAALGIGPALLTLALFVLGTIGGETAQPMLTLPNILLVTVPLSLMGAALAWLKARRTASTPQAPALRLLWDERLLIAMIGAGLVLIWIVTAYWPFIHYDPLWVYGYQGRLYSLKGFIPNDIGYYPPMMSLQYAYGQIAAGSLLDDHAARAVIFPLHVGAILMAYTLGRKLFTRRVGIIAAALWALYPHVSAWASVGDLEIPLTYGFTGAAAFFLTGWHAHTRRERWHYGALGGLFLGIAMWTKPTAGAFILGVVLLVVADLLRVRLNWRAWLPRFEVAIAAGLASIPLGALWYARNLYYGHEPITLPDDFWLTQSLRSGQELGWPLLALFVLAIVLRLTPQIKRPAPLMLWGGLVVIVLAAAPTIIAPRRMMLIEYAGLAAGAAMMCYALWPHYQRHVSAVTRRDAARIGWALLLALPYFVNWFWNYSYHYRLSFAIVPLMLLPTAVILASWLTRERVRNFVGARRTVYTAILVALCVPGVITPLYNYTGGWDWLWSNEFPDDFARLRSFNPALARTVQLLRDDIDTQELENPVIIAPGLQRLPFFFPLDDVRNLDAPTELDSLRDADFYIYTQEARWYYEELGLPPLNQITGSLGRANVIQRVGGAYDTSFYATIYRVHPPERRFRLPRNIEPYTDAAVQFGDFARLAGYRIDTTDDGETPRLTLAFEALAPAPQQYHIFIHLRDEDGQPVATWDSVPAPNAYGFYATTFWQQGEIVLHTRALEMPEGVTLDPDETYTLAVGFYELETHARVETRVDGTITDGWTLEN